MAKSVKRYRCDCSHIINDDELIRVDTSYEEYYGCDFWGNRTGLSLYKCPHCGGDDTYNEIDEYNDMDGLYYEDDNDEDKE